MWMAVKLNSLNLFRPDIELHCLLRAARMFTAQIRQLVHNPNDFCYINMIFTHTIQQLTILFG